VPVWLAGVTEQASAAPISIAMVMAAPCGRRLWARAAPGPRPC
jgi:hypothetical protein